MKKRVAVSLQPALLALAILGQNSYAELIDYPQNPSPETDTTSATPATPVACAGLSSDSERLACYDKIFRAETVALPQDAAPTKAEPLFPDILSTSADEKDSIKGKINAALNEHLTVPKAEAFNPNTSLLDRRWELSEDAKLGTWQLRPYQPMYALPVMWTSNKNILPTSPNPANQQQTPLNINSTEMKFQLSVKAKAVQNIFKNNGDLWLGYTQSSRWQVYTPSNSRPFRETNYEPEASLIFRTNYNLFGLNARLLGVTFNHQSNGRSNPLSRSWNRAILNIGLEKDNFVLMIRPWYRFKEDKDDDNNPDITDYYGHGDITAYYRWQDHQFSLMLRNNLKAEHNRGAVQFDWAFPLSDTIHGHFQFFNGYGESLIDYNHSATYVGLGLSLNNWF